jgi:hypothetical protein
MGRHPNELRLDAHDRMLDDQTFEVLRVWVQHRGPVHTFVNPAVLEDPGAFGTMLATAMHDAARAYQEEWGLDGSDALNRIFQGLYKHLTDPEGSAAESRQRVLGTE